MAEVVAPLAAAPADRVARESLAFLQRVLASYHPRDFAVRLWDGSRWDPEPGRPAHFTLVLQHPGALRAMFLGAGRWPSGPSELAFGEAYVYDDLDIEGDIHAVFPVAEHLLAQRWSLADRLRMAEQLFRLPAPARERRGRSAAHVRGARHSPERDRAAVTYHYDTSNDFYALYLDAQMVYSCAYFHTPEDDLDTAQRQKLDYVCRKLRLRPGMRLLDVGCGWGALVMHAARECGAQARGITLSRPQAGLAGERIRAAGLAGRCAVEVADSRELNGPA